jgi:hypothetical protein
LTDPIFPYKQVASKAEVGGTIYGIIKKLVSGPVRIVNAEGISRSGGTLTQEI